MEVYNSLIKKTLHILKDLDYKELKVSGNVEWKCLQNNEFLMEREVAFELGERFQPCTVYHCPTSDESLVDQDRIILIGENLNEIKGNTNFSRISFFQIDDIKDQNEAYLAVKKLDYERYKIIPEGYMVLSSSVENKENIRVSKKAIQDGISFETIGNLYINHYKQLKGVNHVQIFFIVGDHPCIQDLVQISESVEAVTDAFDHLLKNVILDCEVCPLQVICDDIEELRDLHFDAINRKNKEFYGGKNE